MNWLLTNEVLQYAAWFLALLELVLALYILLLNAWHTANRHLSGLLFLFAVNNLALGMQIGAADAAQAALPTLLLAATSPMIQTGLFLVALVLLKPGWLFRSVPGSEQTRRRPLLWLLYGLLLLPPVLTAIDAIWQTGLWYTGLSEGYEGGFLAMTGYADGLLLSLPLRVVLIFAVPFLTLAPLAYVAFWDKAATRLIRLLARTLLGAQILAIAIQMGLRSLVPAPTTTLLAGALFVLVYAYAAFRQMVSERRVQRGRLQARLTALILAVTVPLLVAVVAFVSLQAGDVIERSADEQLAATNRALAANVDVWLDLNSQALAQLVSLPDVVSMDPERQKPILEAMAEAHPHMYLVSVTDMKGINVARSDDAENKDYHDRLWHIGARNGVPVTYQTLVGRTSGEPALVVSMPIRRTLGTIVGVGMFASDLDDISEEVWASDVGETGFAYVVDGLNQVVAHPVAEYAAELRDLDYYPPVFQLRSGVEGALTFNDEEGRTWRAHVSELENGWGVVVQQEESELLSTLRTVRTISWIVVVGGSLLLVGLMALVVRQIAQPIGTLTETATAIAGGDLSRVAPVESEDEVGMLARAFNSMTEQLRGLIAGLEQEVADRTQDLEQRSRYLEATAEVGQAAASILEPDDLIRQAVDLILERFGLYYVGLFLVDEAGEWAELQAGTGEAGRAMLARGHRIRLGVGMIGWSVAHGEARVAGEAGADAVRLATPELPDTRSEAALPLRSRGRVLGALSVQHTRPGAFDPDTMAVLQTMADQVAVALDNAHLFAESQEALEAERRAYGELTREAWENVLQARPELGYRYAGRRLERARGEWRPEMRQAEQRGQVVQGNGGATLSIPIKVREQVVGALGFRKDSPGEAWTAEERELLVAFVARLEVALESARLYEDTQRRAARERLMGEITGRMRESLDVDTVLQTAVREMRDALRLAEVKVQLEVDET